MKILAIDYGEKKIGIAVSDELGISSAKLPVLYVRTRKEALRKLVDIIVDITPGKIVLGVPYDYKAELNQQSKNILKFKEELIASLENKIDPVPDILTRDESFSTKLAEKGKSKSFKKEKSDSEAARLVLQEYLNSREV